MPSQSRTIVEPFPRHYRNMEIILAKRCKSLTGSFGQYYGYAIRRSGKKFFSVRSPKGPHVRDGHLRFIFACADMAQYNYFIGDINVEGTEWIEAAREAQIKLDSIDADAHYNAEQVRDIKRNHGL